MSTFGDYFRVTTYGESHCRSVGCIIDGCPPGLEISEADIQSQLRRRRPGQNPLVTPRNEKDLVEIQSGVESGRTLGTPICLRVLNEDHRPADYSETDLYPRPSHSDYTYIQKYGLKAASGGGRSSARETIGRVGSGAIAEKYLLEAYGIEIVAFVSAVGEISIDEKFLDVHSCTETIRPEYLTMLNTITRAQVDDNILRCPDSALSDKMRERVERAKEGKDSIGGVVTCVIRNCPAGLGEPCFDKLEAKLAHAMLSIPATKGFEIGSGFAGTRLPGSKHNDMFVPDVQSRNNGNSRRLATKTNNSGGIQGGISNGENIFFRVAFKSPATIGQEQLTSTYVGDAGMLAAKGRHDPCVVPRAVPIVEAMSALTIMDALMAQNARAHSVTRLGIQLEQ